MIITPLTLLVNGLNTHDDVTNFRIPSYDKQLNISFAMRLVNPKDLFEYELSLVLSNDPKQTARVSILF